MKTNNWLFYLNFTIIQKIWKLKIGSVASMVNTNEKKPSNLSQVPLGIWSIGITTTLMTISATMIFTLVPLFLKNHLGASIKDIGIWDGISESISQIVRLFSGPMSDYFGKRKALVVCGYGITTIVKPIFALVPVIGWIIFARFAERVGNGIQATPREALVGDLAPPHLRGTCYGLRQSLTKIGSLAGAGLTWYLMYTTDNAYQFIFWVAVIPAFIGMFILIAFVQDKKTENGEASKKNKRHPIHFRDIIRLGSSFWSVMGVVAVFTLSHCSESFFALRAEHLGLEEKHAPSMILIMNAVIVAIAYYSGTLSDRLGRKIFLLIGFSAQVMSLMALSLAPSWEWVILGVVLWGIQMGTTETMLITVVVDTTPEDLHGTAFGVFFLIRGISLYIASHMTGHLWDTYSPVYAFGACAIIGAMSLGLLSFLKLPKVN